MSDPNAPKPTTQIVGRLTHAVPTGFFGVLLYGYAVMCLCCDMYIDRCHCMLDTLFPGAILKKCNATYVISKIAMCAERCVLSSGCIFSSATGLWSGNRIHTLQYNALINKHFVTYHRLGGARVTKPASKTILLFVLRVVLHRPYHRRRECLCVECNMLHCTAAVQCLVLDDQRTGTLLFW